MRIVILQREPSTDEGTFGKWVSDSGFSCFTGELPWRFNLPGISCIPALTYVCLWQFSPRHGYCYHVQDVPGRSDVEIHSANLMGDKSKGKKSQLLGCIAPGLIVEVREGQLGVWESKEALARLVADLKEQPFQLTIVSS